MLIDSMASSYKQSAVLACAKLLEKIELPQNIHLPYAVPYLNYVLSWPDNLPIKLIIIGQNPYNRDIYPYMGAALSYDPDVCPVPPKSIRSLADDLYESASVPYHQTVRCIRDSWHLLSHGTLMINETVFSSIYPEMKSNYRPIMEMEAQCIVLQALVSASYFMGQKEFTILAMGERAALMADQMKKWCPSDAIKMKIVACRNPAARTVGDMSSLAFTLKHSGASKILASEVKWYHSMPPKESYAEKRLKDSEKLLQQSLESIIVSKNTAKTELTGLMERLKLPIDDGNKAGLEDAMISARKAIIAHTNCIKSNQMNFIQYVNAAKGIMPAVKDTSDNSSAATYKDVSVLATKAPPRKKVIMEEEVVGQAISSIPDIKKELTETTAIPPVIKTPRTTRAQKMISEDAETSIARSVTPSIAQSEVTGVSGATPSKSKRSIKDVNNEEGIHMSSFATWFRLNVSEDPTFAGILQTAVEDKWVGDTPFAASVMRHIRLRKKQDKSYDSHKELNDITSESYKWAVETKTALLQSQ
jgi:uracil DNA glycosylase